MPNLYAQYELDSEKTKNGVPITFAGSTFLCKYAGSGNRAYRFASANEAAAAPDLLAILEGDDEPAKAYAEDELTMRCFYGNVVTGWQDVEDRDGKEMPFTRENFLDLMRSCPMVWESVRMEARDLDNYRLARKEELVEEVGKS